MERKHTVTNILIAINVLVFVIMSINGGSENTEVLVKYGAMNKILVLNGDWWRFFTPIFIHIGLGHIIMNCYSLYILGGIFERIYGAKRFLIIYLLSGIMGNIFSFAFGSVYTISAGASTSLYGMFGLALSMYVFYKNYGNLRTFGRSFFGIIALNIIYSMMNPSIGMLGHLGGLIGGFLLGGMIEIRNIRLNKNTKIIASIVFVVLAAYLLRYGYSI